MTTVSVTVVCEDWVIVWVNVMIVTGIDGAGVGAGGADVGPVGCAGVTAVDVDGADGVGTRVIDGGTFVQMLSLC